MEPSPAHPEYFLAGVLLRPILLRAETGGAFCLFESISPGDSHTPIHVHALEDETIYVLEGELLATIAGKSRALKAGESVFLPRGIPHQLQNSSGLVLRQLLLCTPGGFEGFVAEAGRLKAVNEVAGSPTPEDIARMREVAPRFGITLLAGW